MQHSWGPDLLALGRAIDARTPYHLSGTCQVQACNVRLQGCSLRGLGKDLKAAQGWHKELGLARVLREEGNRCALVHLASSYLEDDTTVLGHATVRSGRRLIRRRRHESQFDCSQGKVMGWCGKDE